MSSPRRTPVRRRGPFDTSSLLGSLPSPGASPRARSEPSVAPPAPSSTYLATVSEPAKTLSPADAAEKLSPLVVVLSLNETLLFRPQRTTKGSVHPIVRPYFATFLSYLCATAAPACTETKGDDKKPSGRPIQLVVYSAARAHNVLTLLRAIGLVPESATTDADGACRPRKGTSAGAGAGKGAGGDVLELVCSRETMGLRDEDYRRDVVTVKDLDKVWDAMGVSHDEGARRTVLLEEEEPAAAAQPHSRLPITAFTVSDPSSALYRRSVRELPTSSSDGSDSALLSTIHLLDLLRLESNAPAALKGGLVRGAENAARRVVREREGKGERDPVSEGEVRNEMARRGRDVCKREGVEVRREWDDKWKEKAQGAAKGDVKA